jgi:hypothetical protein
MSKMRNSTARRKNRRENGMRDLWGGSNPHSNGESFSRSIVVWKLIAIRGRAITHGINRDNIRIGSMDIIGFNESADKGEG